MLIFRIARRHAQPLRATMGVLVFVFYFVNEEHADDDVLPRVEVIHHNSKKEDRLE